MSFLQSSIHDLRQKNDILIKRHKLTYHMIYLFYAMEQTANQSFQDQNISLMALEYSFNQQLDIFTEKQRRMRKWRKQNFLFKILTISIQFNKNITSFEKKMSHQNIFLDQETYSKKNHSLENLVELQNKEDSRQIARYFLSKEWDFNGLKEAVCHQVDTVIENLPGKHKQIFKNKFRSIALFKKSKNGKIQQSVKDINTCNSNTEVDHQILDLFDNRYTIQNKFHC